jgi:signal transduction histidine kinase/CheY-like chemotaxis protein
MTAAALATTFASDEQQLQALATEEVARRLRAHDISLTLSNAAAVLVTAAVFHSVVPRAGLWIWLGLEAVSTVYHLYLGVRWRSRKLTTTNAPAWLRVVTRTSVINGLLWMLIALLAWPQCNESQRMMAAFGNMGIASMALHTLHSHLPAYYAMGGLCTAGLVMALLWSGGLANWALVLMVLLYLLVCARFATLLNRMLMDTLRKGHQMVELTAKLQVEKDRAVNLSKSRSRFLAAASHDLRQPVHALSLFVGALHQSPSPEQSGVILQHVGTAVDTMGSMFDALLDISKLDADLLQPNWQVVDLQPLLARIDAEHAVLASAKGLSFRTDTTNTSGQSGRARMLVRTDPVLLERVLRNLLSNAIRYTAQGRVLIRARARAQRVELVVADTGMGMPKHRREEAFEEFVQLHDEHEVAHDPQQGLGLGLAIVRRLVGLLGLRLVLRSRPGRGTVFALHLPLLEEGWPSAAPAHTQQASSMALTGLSSGDVVIVIDDNVAIQVAMQALLSAWGCQVYVAANPEALMPQLMGLQAAPALLLCDSRLRDGEGGINAIAEIREAFNLEVPAILISGDTGPERLREAVASGLPLLHKPVTQAHLREAIARVMTASKAPLALS